MGILILLIALFIYTPTYAAHVIGSGVDTTSVSYNYINLWLTFEEGDTTETYDIIGTEDCSQGVTAWSYEYDATLESAGSELYGDYSLSLPGDYDYMTAAITDTVLQPASGRFGFVWENKDSLDVGDITIFRIDGSGGGRFQIRALADRTLKLSYYDGSGTFRVNLLSSSTYAVDTEYFIEVEYVIVTDTLILYMDGVSEATNSTDLNSVIDPSSLSLLVPVVHTAMLFDNILVSNDSEESLYDLRAFTTSQAHGTGALCR